MLGFQSGSELTLTSLNATLIVVKRFSHRNDADDGGRHHDDDDDDDDVHDHDVDDHADDDHAADDDFLGCWFPHG